MLVAACFDNPLRRRGFLAFHSQRKSDRLVIPQSNKGLLMDVGLIIASVKNAVSALSAVQSNEVLRERIAFIGEQIDILQKTHAATEKKLAEAEAKNIELTKQIEAYRAKEQFILHRTAAFRKEPSGGYARAVYCPNCFKAVGADFSDSTFHCASCGWVSEFERRELDDVMSSLT